MYDRMATSIAQNPSSTGRALASIILQCVSCAFRRISVAELSQAIKDDLSEVLDFQQSIVDLCGGFVVIDNGGNAALIHQTAREYLLGDDDRPFRIEREAAHQQIFLSCMQCLMSSGLRGKLSRNSKPEFLDYAATWWSSHLSHIPVTSVEAAGTLNKFLSGHWVLIWIHVLATSGQLRGLVQASKHLSKYATKLKERDVGQYDGGKHMQLQLLESWAVDYVRIVGKFGTSLRRSPDSIYKLIPPFCPRNTAIYQQFGKMEARNLKVSGQSTEDWDDLLARLSLGFGIYASSITAAGAQIAVLATSGMVFIFEASTFEESTVSPIRHGERVYRMEMSSSGTLLATYGFKTTKLWEVSTGTCKLAVDNVNSRPRPLAMLMTNNNTELLVGADDRRIRSLNLTEASPKWQDVVELEEPELGGHFLNSSSYMALNDDGSLIAVAYRGHPLSAWETDGPVHLGHCWRQRKELARGEVIDAVWHPYNPEVFGLYIEGVVFHWCPYEGDVDEFVTGASRLAISNDGNLLATGDVHGIVKIYNTSDFSSLYQLATQDSVLGLTFSPDSRRFYDLRGYYGNAWEPSVLTRYAEHGGKRLEHDDETTSLAQSSTVAVSYSQKVQPITVLAGSPRGRFYCSGTEYGNVRVLDVHSNKSLELHVSKSFLSIEQLAWSEDGRYVCFSDSSKKIFVTSIITAASDSEITAEVQSEISVKGHTKGPILQLLFSPDSRQLLICTSFSLCTVDLGSVSVTNSVEWATDKSKWIPHPQDISLIFRVTPCCMNTLNWDLKELQRCDYEVPAAQDGKNSMEYSSNEAAVDRVLATQDKKRLLVQLSCSSQQSKEKVFLCFKVPSPSTLASANLDSCETITAAPTRLPRSISSQIATALSFLSQDRLIYLSKKFSICSWRLQTSSESIRPTVLTRFSSDAVITASSSERSSPDRRHSHNPSGYPENPMKELFMLPGDWIGRDCLALCYIWGAEESLMVPRNGEVALVCAAALA